MSEKRIPRQTIHKRKVLFLDDKMTGNAKEIFGGYYLYFKPWCSERTIVPNKEILESLIQNGKIGEYDIVVLHLGFSGGNSDAIAELVKEHAPEARFGIISGANEGELIAREFGPDFFCCYSELKFITEQIEKGRITEKEEKWRGLEVLTPMSQVDSEGRLTGRRYRGDFMPRKTIRREREGD